MWLFKPAALPPKAINLKCPRGIELCLRMMERVGFVIDNFRSGTHRPSSEEDVSMWPTT
jgi:hypothetical protein